VRYCEMPRTALHATQTTRLNISRSGGLDWRRTNVAEKTKLERRDHVRGNARRSSQPMQGNAMPPYRSRTTTHGRNMAGARGLWRATGMKDGDFGKPIIAVVNSFTQFVP